MKICTNLLGLMIMLTACTSMSQQTNYPSPGAQEEFKDYWYDGSAELASYELEQARYGEMRTGDAVLIFVTEPFSKDKQVKLDNPSAAGSDKVSVMKLNFTKKFTTGIYPYSMMYSVFTPVPINTYPRSLKLTTTSQEWCGHTFLQMNLKGDSYKVNGFSYFESEGDESFDLDAVMLEDELWTKIRLSPESLPTGEFQIIPSTFYHRLRHTELTSETVNATLALLDSSAFSSQPHKVYGLEYTDRRMKIFFDNAFPYQILGWEETYGSGSTGSELMTRATLKATLKTDYWSKNSNADSLLRRELKLKH